MPYGAAGRLAVRGLLEAVPLDGGSLLEAAGPNKGMKLNPAAVESRHDDQVKRALAIGPCAVLVLGDAHELSGSVRWLGGRTTEYVRVTPRRLAGASR